MKLRLLLCVLMILTPCQPIFAWSECGHHIIALMAFKRLAPEKQQAMLELLKSHPKYNSDFLPPALESPEDTRLWLAGRAGYWPDVARNDKKLNRPAWHYQLGSSIVLGNANAAKVHVTPPATYGAATMETQELQIAQAFNLCKDTLKDKQKPASDRALAICWIGHLVADAHQPCHAGSLYSERIFQEGDRGGNSIPTKQGRNLHALWDGLLGNAYDSGDIKRRVKEIESNIEAKFLVEAMVARSDFHDFESWLRESRQHAITFVYKQEIIQPVLMAGEDGTPLRPIELSEDYLKTAGWITQLQASLAAERLAKAWDEAIDP